MSVKHVSPEQFSEITALLDQAAAIRENMNSRAMSLSEKLRALETIKALHAKARAIGS